MLHENLSSAFPKKLSFCSVDPRNSSVLTLAKIFYIVLSKYFTQKSGMSKFSQYIHFLHLVSRWHAVEITSFSLLPSSLMQ